MRERTGIRLTCQGWWEQHCYGRQPMNDLTLALDEGRIEGSGYDIVGPFVLSGRLGTGSSVVIEKYYLGSHRVRYLGAYDGEGTMSGEWRIGYDSGRWAIAIRGGDSQASSEIVELLPVEQS